MTQDKYASDLDACDLLEQVDNSRCTFKQNDETMSVESIDDRNLQTTESNHMIKKIDKLPNLNQYFNEALDNEIESQRTNSKDAITQIVIDKPDDVNIVEGDIDARKSRDVRSSTVYSRSDSESSNIFHKSISRDSSSPFNESNTQLNYRQGYNRNGSSNSFIQNELDSEEYHHDRRFSMTAETLEYIRGRDDWKVHSENILNNIYSRQSSNISIQSEIDSDEYHHDRVVTDLIEMAYLETDNIQSLPSSFEDNTVFDRYYLELQQINGQLANDIERNIAQKQIVLIDSTEVEGTDGYLYPLPDIVLDQIVDHDIDSYTIEHVDSDYSNLSESEDDVQSVIEVNHDGEIITTLDMRSDVDEMIEVTLWDLKDDHTKEFSSKESSVEIIGDDDLVYVEHTAGEKFFTSYKKETNDATSEITEANGVTEQTNLISKSSIQHINDTATNDLPEKIELMIEEEYRQTTNDVTATNDVPENATLMTHDETNTINNVTMNNLPDNTKIIALEEISNNNGSETINDFSTTNEIPENISNIKDDSTVCETNIVGSLEVNTVEPESSSLHSLDQNIGHHSSTIGETSKSFIEHESESSASETNATNNTGTVETTENPKKPKKSKKVCFDENVDDLIKEGCMGVWFHK